jgi:PAS domain S-box-containing protein
MTDRIPSSPQVTESHYRQIVQSAVHYAIVSCDLECRVTSWNEGAHRVLGWTEAEMRGQPVHRFFTPEDVAGGAVEREMDTARRNGVASDERWHVRKNGERFWAVGELMALKDEGGGRITGFVKILRDRSFKQRRDAQLRELNDTLAASEERLQMALDVGGMGVWQCDLKSGAVHWWPGMDRIHGLPANARPMHLDEYRELIYPDDRSRVVASVRNAIENKSAHQLEYRVLWPDATVHWLEVRAKLLMDLQGEPWQLSGVCLDVTGRKRIERDLKFVADASNELAGLRDYQDTLNRVARLAVPHFADWCAIDMLEGGSLQRVAIAHVDPAKEQLARELQRRFPADLGGSAAAGRWNVLRTGRAERVREMTGQLLDQAVPDPDHRAALLALGLRSYMCVPLAARGAVLGVITFATAESLRRYTAQDQALAEDLARRAAVAIDHVMLLRELRDSDRAKDVFLATLAHELRNPLAPVWNGLTIIKRSPGDAKRVQHVADMIERQVGQMARLVDDLLDLSRIGTGKIELKKERTDLASILRSAIETSRPHIQAAHHKLSLRLPPEPVELEADAVRLAQVFSNLLNNAAKYTRPGGNIDVDAVVEARQVVVRVRDNGCGIAPEMLGKVFALFTQGSHPSESSQGGLGIGLSLVDGLVRLHGGSVDAHSEGLDKGSEFVVRLPRADVQEPVAPVQPHETARQRQDAGATRNRPRVLVVDDNGDAAGTLAELLQMLGSEVSVAHDGASALTQTDQFRPDVVLLDIGLPDMNGYEVARRIRSVHRLRQPRLIALTGWGQDEDKRLAQQAGFDEHWTKPVDPQRLQDLAA